MRRKITIVGLGPGNPKHLSLETLEVLKNAEQLVLRTQVHPSVSELLKENIKFSSCDKFYEQEESFKDVYQKIVEHLIKLAKENNLEYGVDVYPYYGSDADAALRAGNDVRHCLIGSGVYASHGYERSHIKGVENTYNLAKAFLSEI